MSSREPSQRPPSRTVTDPAWEHALLAGQAEEGEQGSIEPELSVVHLLRHARSVEALDDAALDRVWGEIGTALPSTTPWWRRSVVWWSALGVGVSAAAIVFVIGRGDGQPLRGAPEIAAVDAPRHRAGQADALERQFELLAPEGRRRVAADVDDGRDRLRADLLARATTGVVSGGGSGGDAGGGR
jgi:hypothetical protein